MSRFKVLLFIAAFVALAQLTFAQDFVLPEDYEYAKSIKCSTHPPLDIMRREAKETDAKDRRDVEESSVRLVPSRGGGADCHGPVNFYSWDYSLSSVTLNRRFNYYTFEVEPNITMVFRYLSENATVWNATWSEAIDRKLNGGTTILPSTVIIQLPDIAIERAFGDILNEEMIVSEEALDEFEHLANVTEVFDEATNRTILIRHFNVSQELLLGTSATMPIGGAKGEIISSESVAPTSRALSNTTTATLTVAVHTVPRPGDNGGTGGFGLMGIFGVTFTSSSTGTRNSGGNKASPEDPPTESGAKANETPQEKTSKVMPIAVGASVGGVVAFASVVVGLKVAAVGPFAPPPSFPSV